MTKKIQLFDHIFHKIGHLGPHQILLYLLIGIYSFPDGYQNTAINFLAAHQPHWCRVKRLERFSFERQRFLSIPDANCKDDKQVDNNQNIKWDSCRKFDFDFMALSDGQILGWSEADRLRLSVNGSRVGCNGEWVYDKSEFVSTTLSLFDQVCDKSWLNQFHSTMYIAGTLIGSPLSGILSEKLGRKPTILIGSILRLIFAISGSFSPNTLTFLLLRFALSVGNTIAYLGAFVLAMEVIGPKYREVTGILYQCFYSFGFMVLPAIAWFIRDFKRLQLVMGMSIIPSIILVLFIPESPRWLLSKRRLEDTLKVLKSISIGNGNPGMEVQLSDLERILENEEKINNTPSTAAAAESTNWNLNDLKAIATLKEESKSSKESLLSSRLLMIELIVCSFAWFTNSLVYYGLSLNTGRLSGSIFLNTFISGAVELPAHILAIIGLRTIGRQRTFSGAFLFAGLASIANVLAIAVNSSQPLQTTLSMLGKSSITISFDIAYVYTAELFPTTHRPSAVGLCSAVARISGMASPYVGGPLQNVWKALPSLIFGVFAFLSFIATAMVLPETKGRPLPDTVREAEDIARLKKRGVCGWCCCCMGKGKRVGPIELDENKTDSVST